MLKYRWFVMAGVGVIAIYLEISERLQIHDLELNFIFFFEAFLEGLVIPILGGLLLSTVERATQERYRVANQLAIKNSLIQAIHNAQNWNELLRIIAEFPRSTLPMVGSVLLVNEPGGNQFKPEAFWGLYGLNPDAYNNCYQARICESCAFNRSSQILKACDCEEGLPSKELAARLCLPLINANQIIALLHIFISPGVKITEEQSKILENLAPVMAMAIDNARSKRMNVFLKESNDAELRRIARDLHDNQAQSLIFVRHKLDQLSGKDALGEITDLRKDLERMRQVVDEAYIDVRSILKELESRLSADLPRMLQDYCRLVEDRNTFRVHFRNDGLSQPMPTYQARKILAIFGEILANVEKHAGAQNIDVRVAWENENLTLTIVDDGRGFETSNYAGIPVDGHMGLAILRERAEELSGSLSIESAKGQGTAVTVSLPMNANVKDVFLVQDWSS